MWKDPKYRAYMSVALKEAQADEAVKARHKAGLIESWADGSRSRSDLAERNEKRWAEQEAKDHFGGKIKALWETSEYREKQKKVMNDRWADPLYVEKIKRARAITAANSEYIAKLSAKRKEYWAKKREQKELAARNEIVCSTSKDEDVEGTE
jgi:hypothetical protein